MTKRYSALFVIGLKSTFVQKELNSRGTIVQVSVAQKLNQGTIGKTC